MCLSVRHTLFTPFNGLFAPEVQCPNILDIRNPWGKVMERNGLRFKFVAQKLCKIAAAKQVFFLLLLPAICNLSSDHN